MSVQVPEATSQRSYDPNNDTITLSWGESPQNEVSTLEPEMAETPAEEPPGYDVAQKPVTTLIYTFSQLGFNSMVLVPPSTAPDTRPPYYVSTSMNVFMPFSYVTSIYRGANENGELAGEFEMGISTTPAKMKMQSMAKNRAINTVLRWRKGPTWEWTPSDREGSDSEDNPKFNLQWTSLRGQILGYVCHTFNGAGKEEKRLARYTFPSEDSLQLYTQSTLEVTAAGQDYFDHILMSVLIIERKRLTPKFEYTTKLFNHL